MVKIHYRIVPHDGGWAYKLNDVFSEPFPSKAAALAAAKIAAWMIFMRLVDLFWLTRPEFTPSAIPTMRQPRL